MSGNAAVSRSPSFWQNKHLVVTGASSGLGAAIGRLAAQSGARVSLIARRGELLSQIATEITSTGATAFWIAADVCDREALQHEGMRVPVLQLGLPDRFVDHGDQAHQLASCGLDGKGVVAAIRAKLAE